MNSGDNNDGGPPDAELAKDDSALERAGGHELIQVGTANGPLEAQALQDYLDAHDILCHVQGTEHSSLLGNMGNLIIELNLMVPRRHAHQAVELIEAFRNATPEFDEQDYEWNETDDDALAMTEHGKDRGILARIGRDPSTATTLAIVPSFGFGHIYTGAWLRGGILAMTEMIGLAMLGASPLTGVGLVALAVLVDLFGARARVNAQGPVPEQPRARLPRVSVVRMPDNHRDDRDDRDDLDESE